MLIYLLLLYCDGKAEFSGVISVTWSFRNHSKLAAQETSMRPQTFEWKWK